MTLLLVDHAHVDSSELRGDLFPRHYTGITSFEHEPEPQVSVEIDESWNQTFPVYERREDAWLR